MRTLIFYDATGRIWFTMGVDETPSGLDRYVFEIPEGANITGMDMTDPEHPAPIYEEPGEAVDINQMAEDITDIQVALAEVYELIAGGEE